MPVSKEFIRQLEGYGLASARILYHFPDFPNLLQIYVWQEYDVAPKFPVLHNFLNYWQHNIEGRLHSIRLAHSRLIKPAEFNFKDGEFRLH
jgi:uncharacterized protein Usg